MLDKKKYPRCVTCLHRIKRKFLPDECSWAGKWCRNVTDNECWYGNKMEVCDNETP